MQCTTIILQHKDKLTDGDAPFGVPTSILLLSCITFHTVKPYQSVNFPYYVRLSLRNATRYFYLFLFKCFMV